jgi:hypothetical protein
MRREHLDVRFFSYIKFPIFRWVQCSVCGDDVRYEFMREMRATIHDGPIYTICQKCAKDERCAEALAAHLYLRHNLMVR